MTDGGVTLVTGATGTVGRHVADLLESSGRTVRRAVRELSRDPTAVTFDFADRSTWAAALEGMDRLFLMRPPAISDVSGVISPFVAEAARLHPELVVVLSLMGVNPAMPHWRMEKDVKASGVPWCMLRPAFFMQNLETAYREDVVRQDRIRLPAGQGRTSFIDTRDVAEVAARALGRPADHAGRAHTLTGPEALPWADVASMLSAELGRPIRYEPISFRTARRELKEAGLPADYVNVQLLINLVARLGRAARVTDDLRRLLGREPRTMRDYVHDRREVWLVQQ